MNTIKKYGFILLIVIPLLILIIVRLSGVNHFKQDANKWAEPSVNKTNILSPEQVDKLSANKLFISDGDNDQLPNPVKSDSKCISFDDVLNKSSLKTIRKHDGPIIVYSNDISISARIWMLVSQMGIEDVFILSTHSDNEILKNNTGLTN